MAPVILSAAALLCVLKSPIIGDAAHVMQAPLPRNLIRLAADVAGCVPHAWPVALALGILAAGDPSGHPLADGQTTMGRGGHGHELHPYFRLRVRGFPMRA